MQVLRNIVTYSVSSGVILLGAALWAWGFCGVGSLSTQSASDIAGLGAGILSGGVVAAAFAWTEGRLRSQQEAFLHRFQLGLQSNLTGVDVSKQNLAGVYLSGKNLSHGRLVETNLENAMLISSNLDHADLSGAVLRGCRLVDATLRDAFLTGADLRGADLTGADLSNATLVGADFREANIREVNFRNADASNADFGAIELTAEQLDQFGHKPKPMVKDRA